MSNWLLMNGEPDANQVSWPLNNFFFSHAITPRTLSKLICGQNVSHFGYPRASLKLIIDFTPRSTCFISSTSVSPQGLKASPRHTQQICETTRLRNITPEIHWARITNWVISSSIILLEFVLPFRLTLDVYTTPNVTLRLMIEGNNSYIRENSRNDFSNS